MKNDSNQEWDQGAVAIELPDYHEAAMGCGLEDRDITDRYEAMRHGWDCAMDRVFEQIPDEPLYTHALPAQPAEPAKDVGVLVEALERKLPGGKQTDDFESSRIGDYNQGWNDYRKAVKKMFKNINMNSSENSNPDAYLYSLEYGEKVVDTKVSIHQLNYPFGVAGADYLVRNDDGVSYVRQTKLYAALSRAQAAPVVGVPDACVWTQDTDYETDVHYSACGEAWSFIEGGPKENKVRFCQGCGKPVVIAYQPKIGGV